MNGAVSPAPRPAGDSYPSRLGGEAAILPRLDPTLHDERGAGAPGPLQPEQLRQFERDGVLVLPSFFPQQRAAAARRHAMAIAQERRRDPSPDVVREPNGDRVRSLFAVHATDPLFASIIADPLLVRIAMQIVGSPVYVHQSRVNLKPGFDGREFDWHSDFETWHTEDGMPRMRAISCSIHLDANLPFNGPLMVITGSHRHFVSCAGRTPAEHYRQSLRKQVYGVPAREHLTWLCQRGSIVTALGNAGTVTLFDCNAMHGSNGNITPLPRSNLFVVFNSVHNALVEPFGGVPPRPNFIANRDCTPLVA